jgi:integrase
MGIKKLAMGKYLIDLTWTEGGQKRRLRRQFFGSLKDVRKLEAELKNEARTGSLRTKSDDPEPVTFTDFAWDWHETYVKANNRECEQKTKEIYLRVHLVPFFGHKQLNEVDKRDLERFKAEKIREGQSPASVNHYLKCLQTLYQCALEWGLVDVNPVKGVPRLKLGVEKWAFLDFADARKFLEAVPVKWHPLFLCGLRTGMRQGEILALRWQDIDWKRKVIRVRHSLSDGRLTPTKSNQARDIPLTTDLLHVLKSIHSKGSEYVFPAGDGRPLHRKTLSRPTSNANRHSGVKRIRFHDLRHTFASHLVMSGVPIRTVQELLGHEEITTTMRYVHLTPEFRHEAIRKLEHHVLTDGSGEKVTLATDSS